MTFDKYLKFYKINSAKDKFNLWTFYNFIAPREVK